MVFEIEIEDKLVVVQVLGCWLRSWASQQGEGGISPLRISDWFQSLTFLSTFQLIFLKNFSLAPLANHSSYIIPFQQSFLRYFFPNSWGKLWLKICSPPSTRNDSHGIAIKASLNSEKNETFETLDICLMETVFENLWSGVLVDLYTVCGRRTGWLAKCQHWY